MACFRKGINDEECETFDGMRHLAPASQASLRVPGGNDAAGWTHVPDSPAGQPAAWNRPY